MKNIQSFKLCRLILGSALLAGFGIVVPYASAQALIDLNSKTATMLDVDNPVAVNNSGQVVGSTATPEGIHAVITGPNGVGMTEIGIAPQGINDAGQVVEV